MVNNRVGITWVLRRQLRLSLPVIVMLLHGVENAFACMFTQLLTRHANRNRLRHTPCGVVIHWARAVVLRVVSAVVFGVVSVAVQIVGFEVVSAIVTNTTHS